MGDLKVYTQLVPSTASGAATVKTAANRAMRSWMVTACDTIRLLRDPEKLRYCRIDTEFNDCDRHNWFPADDETEEDIVLMGA